jgi:hypothetical protein
VTWHGGEKEQYDATTVLYEGTTVYIIVTTSSKMK